MVDLDGFARRLDLALKVRRVGKMYALAVALGIDESALSRWRRGKPISVGNLIRLSQHLQISIDWLLTGAGTMDVAEPRASDAWQSEILADLASLDPAIGTRFADLMRHLAEARRAGRIDAGAWTSDDFAPGAPRSNGAGPKPDAARPALPAGSSAEGAHGHAEPAGNLVVRQA